MEAVNSMMPLYVMATPLVAVVLIYLTGKSPNVREACTIIASVVMFSLVASMAPAILDGKVLEYHLFTLLPGLDIRFKVDSLGIFFALLASFLWIITSFYAIGYMRSAKEKKQTRFYACFALTLSATMGVAFSGNMITTFVFYEVITFATYPLVGHKETPEALGGARKYLTYLMGTSVAFFLTAIVSTYYMAGTLDYSNQGLLSGALVNGVSSTLLSVTFLLYIAGIAKAAIMPFHSWLPSAMVAPTPVSALLHAVAVVKTGVFVIIKVVIHVFGIKLLSELGISMVLVVLASTTIILASINALKQDNLKARLAYSTISQLSYVVLGVALLSPAGIMGSILHIVLHAFGKITLFFTAGAIYVATHKTKVSELNGIGRKMPLTMGAFTIAAFSMIGVPPFAGFITKWYLVTGSFEADFIPVLAVLATSTLLNASYFLPIVYSAFFKEPDAHEHGEHGDHGEAPMLMTIPLLLTALGVCILFFFPSIFYDLAKITVEGLM